MAITWELKRSPIDISSKEAQVVATRTDSEDLANPRVYTLDSVTLKNESQKLLAFDRIWKMHLAQLDLEQQTADFLKGFEGQGKANLEARE